MNLLLYLPTESGPGARLQQLLAKMDAAHTLEIFQTLKTLSFRLRQPHYDCDLAIFLAATPRDLLDLCTVSHLFQDLRTILILPDRSDDSITRAHALYPRVISYIDGDFMEIAAVLERLSHGTENIGWRRGAMAVPR